MVVGKRQHLAFADDPVIGSVFPESSVEDEICYTSFFVLDIDSPIPPRGTLPKEVTKGRRKE
ncbi:hypothetical protein P7K49_035558, partial [Saguinus oedipus]